MTMTGEFGQATAVVATDMSRRQFDAVISHRFNIGPIPNGGYLLGVGAKAIAAALEHTDPLSITAYYLDKGDNAEARLSVDVLRTGRSVSTASCSLLQGGSERVRFLAAFGDLHAQSGETHVEEPPPPIPAPEQCAYPNPMPVAINDVVDVRFAEQSRGWLDGEPGESSELVGWIRFRDGSEPDVYALLLFADAFPPAVFNRTGRRGWVPTIELTVHVRRHPAPGWCLCRFRTRYLVNGLLEADGEIWDSTGEIVAVSRQLAKLRLPAAG